MFDYWAGCSRPIRQFCSIVIASICTLFGSQKSFADGDIPRETLPISWQTDADLTDVFFLNRNLGWAVGSQGVVLRTVNGGKNWLEISQVQAEIGNELPLDQKIRNLQAGVTSRWTGITNGDSSQFKKLRCRFESVHFVDERTGWVAGGYDVPYVNKSRAVVLKTNDGGVTWQPVEGLVIPRIKRVVFRDAANGWAVGEKGNLFRTGIYYSSDGGHTWSSQSSGEMKDWIDGERAGNGFVNLDTSGHPGVVRNNRYDASVLAGRTQPRLNALRMIDEKQGWAVGNGGAIVQTTNGGLSWSDPISAGENSLFQHFDFSCTIVSGGKIWIAGNPGTTVFSIDLTSGEIYAHRTGIRRPIHDIHFVDDQFGWMAGALGTIVATTDGGKTWQLQRGKNQSLAMLGIALQESELPLEQMALLAGEENRVCGAAVLTNTIDSVASEGARQSMERLGCSTLISVGLGTGNESDRLEKLVRTIRTLRPNVIICNSKVRLSHGSVATIDLQSFLPAAIRAAADPTAFPDQIEQAALTTWQVDRLALPDATGKISVDPRRMLPRTGSTVEDRIAISRALLDLPQLDHNSNTYRVQDFTVPSRGRASDLFAGLSQAGRQIPTREAIDGFRSNLNAIKLATSKQEKIKKLAGFEIDAPQDFRVWHQQVLSWTMSLDENVAGVWLFQLAEHYLQLGKTELAAHTLEVMATRFSEHAFSSAALTWLAQHYASNEMGLIAFQHFADQQIDSQSVVGGSSKSRAYEARPIRTTVDGVSQMSWSAVTPKPKKGQEDLEPNELKLTNHTEEASTVQTAEVKSETRDNFFQVRWQRASQFLARLGQQDPDLVAGSQYRLIEAQIKRKLTGAASAEGVLKQLSQDKDSSVGIAVGAHRELVLGDVSQSTPAEIVKVTCHRRGERPRLDGVLDDAVWVEAIDNDYAQQLILTSSDASLHQQPDQAMFAFDDQFLYVAFRCFKLKGQYYQPSQQPRPRDPDLSRRDRIEFAIDTDRDYRTAQHFVVDHRGWVAEHCGGAKGWNPDWYVSHGDEDDSWTVELAIPLNQLVAGPLESDATWAIRMARRTYDSQDLWASGDGSNMPESFGLQVGFLSQPAQYELMQFK